MFHVYCLYCLSSLCEHFTIVGERTQSENFVCRVVQRPGGRFDSIFFSAENKRFKSMVDVARFLNLATGLNRSQGKDSNSRISSRPKKVTGNKKLKRELDKLTKSKIKAVKALDGHNNEGVVNQFPASNDSLWGDECNVPKAQNSGLIVPRPDIESFPGIPTHCIPDLLMVWDFLSTFGRTLSLQPIELDDFAAALSFPPSTQPTQVQSQLRPQLHIPVYLSECHIALLRMLVKDPSSDLWWWSVLETPEMVEQEDEHLNQSEKKRKTAAAVVKIDMEILLSVEEDPAVTRKWLQALEDVRTRKPDNSGPIKSAVKSAIAVTTNQHVKNYLKKAMRTWKAKSAGLVKRAVVWLIGRVREARPDLWGRKVSNHEITEQKKLVATEAALEMDNIVDDNEVDDGDLNLEGDSDEDSDSDEDEGSDNEDEYADQVDTPDSPSKLAIPNALKESDEITPVTTFVPAKPVPSIVDLLLPPAKPVVPSDLVHALTWPPVIGATSSRIFQWYKRRRNEVDDSIREFRELRPMSIAERRRREMSVSLRILSECGDSLESAINHLCDGKDYLDLNSVQKLSILRILIEAAYDTHVVQSCIEDNFKARINAVKALDAEERRAKKAAREESASIESAARNRLATEARDVFIEKKRQEITEDAKDTQEYSFEFIESLNDDDIIDLDEDTKAEYEALPAPESFNKAEVNIVVRMIQEETAFGVEKLTVLTRKEIEERDEDYLKSLKDEMESYGEVDSRETSAKVDRLRVKITKFSDQMQTISDDRNLAIEALKDAIEDGTVRTLRSAMKQARLARLTGDDEDIGVWALDLVRDASLELKDAERRKRVTEAQKDLVAKRNKCFFRTEPLGRDRYQSSFVRFDYDKSSRVWVERDFILDDEKSSCSEEAVLLKSPHSVSFGEQDKFDDFVDLDDCNQPYRNQFLSFTRQEYHHTGKLSTLSRHHWSCYTTDRSLRVLVKNLDGNCAKENALKEMLKETLEALALSAGGGDVNASHVVSPEGAVPDTATTTRSSDFLSSGDDAVFSQEKKRFTQGLFNEDVMDLNILNDMSSIIGRRTRIRKIPDPDRAPDVAEYSMATITGWKMENRPINDGSEDKEHNADSQQRNTSEDEASAAMFPIWRLELDDGGELHVSASEAVRGIVRAIKWSTEYPGYVEHDAPFLSYRNGLGRFCGRAVEAPLSLTSQAFAKQMIKREQDLYMPLKNRSLENNWGGKAGARQAWVSSLKDCGYTFEAVRDGLLTLENAFFDLARVFVNDEEKKKNELGVQPTAGHPNGGTLTGKDLLYDHNSRFDIELESLENDVNGLWNNYDSRKIFHEIIVKSKTVSVLALGLALICRNAQAYINRTKSSVVQSTHSEQVSAAYVGRRRAAMQRPGAYTDFF